MNQVVQQALEQNLLQIAQQMEQQVDAELNKLENLEEDDIDRIRQKRIEEMKR